MIPPARRTNFDFMNRKFDAFGDEFCDFLIAARAAGTPP
ncbi:hypothetical protein WM41_2222 [Corynebacterium simulans]|uniref:Uncharacterized protein n=1 Tax=Corynebacterium simulans TaxID=146827 RepID=A0ABR5V656_9CORY|nr:hypothetical protein WM41_2222 [Corynebacterium simulans]